MLMSLYHTALPTTKTNRFVLTTILQLQVWKKSLIEKNAPLHVREAPESSSSLETIHIRAEFHCGAVQTRQHDMLKTAHSCLIAHRSQFNITPYINPHI